jgi:tetratricopeptide (TPR) repeat protein
MTSYNPISVFTPSRSKPEDLEAIMVQRHDLLTDAVERIEESASTDNKHHLLFVGPRGVGKTHLMTLLVHRLSTIPNLRIAWLNEDETSTTLIEFLLRIYTALQKRYPLEFSADDVDPIYDLSPSEAESELIQILLQKFQSNSLLVVVENLDALFESLGKEGQQKLRAFIQEHPILSIVATAQRLVEGISKRTNAFFGFFQIENLKPLTVEGAAELLSNIARYKKEQELADFIETPVGLSRIRALHHLSGGNHRIYIVLSQFITSKTIDLLVEPFAKMIDEMTPYYQERIRWLPPQQRKIIEFLCNVERPATVKQIARRLFTSNQTISSQLKDLRGKGYVQSAQRGRESLYEITEPLMRICVEVKENQNSEPLKILVDFLRVWYDGVELSSLLDRCDPMNSEYDYLLSAINRNSESGSLRSKIFVASFYNNLGESQEELNKWSELEVYLSVSESLGVAYSEWAGGRWRSAIDIIDAFLGSNDVTGINSSVSEYLKGNIYLDLGDYRSALVCFDTGLSVTGLPSEFIEVLLVKRLLVNHKLKNFKEEINDVTSLLNDENKPVEEKAGYLFLRSESYKELNCKDEQLSDLTKIVEMKGVPEDVLLPALFARGSLLIEAGDYRSAVDHDFKRILDGDFEFTSINYTTLVFYALLNIGSDQWEGAEKQIEILSSKAQDYPEGFIEALEVIIQVVFTEMSGRSEVIKEFSKILGKRDQILVLLDELIAHLGRLFLNTGTLPDSSLMDSWINNWEAALSSYPEASISLRIFRTGVEFLKSGGEDRSVLLSLHQEERRILEQVFQLEG